MGFIKQAKAGAAGSHAARARDEGHSVLVYRYLVTGMAEPDLIAAVKREDGESLVLNGLTLARAFFTGDPSSKPGGYDSLAGSGDRNRIVAADVIAMNTTMRARSKHAAWKPLLEDDQAWLRNVPFKLDIVQAEEKDWVTANGDALLSQAIAACIHPGIGLASATKVLHLKRPYLVPILDRFVAEMMGVNLPDNPSVTQRVAIGQRLAAAIRREGRRNIQVLRRIQEELASEGIERTLVRIFDGILWYSHPAAGVPGGERTISVGIRAREGGSCRPMSTQQQQRLLSGECHQPSRTPGSAPTTAAPSRDRGPRIAAVHALVEAAVRDGLRASCRLAAVAARRWKSSSPSRLPGRTRDVGGDDIGRVPVQAAAGPVIPDRSARVRMRRRLLHIPQRHSGIQTGNERFTSHAGWVLAERAGGRHSSGLVMTGSCQFSRVA